jgi:hypothetical protein
MIGFITLFTFVQDVPVISLHRYPGPYHADRWQVNFNEVNDRQGGRFSTYYPGAESIINNFHKITKKKIYSRTFVDETNAGTVLEMGNAGPPGGLTSIFTLVPPGTAFTRKEISTSSPGGSVVTALLPIVVVKMPVESLVP